MTTPDAESAAARERLARSQVLVVGVGALGCPAALHLAEAGVGRLVLMDPDRVEVSNLHRQILHRTSAIGTAKAVSAAERLRARFPALDVEARVELLGADNLAALFRDADFIIDGTDGVAAKFLINDGAVRWRRPYSHAGILGFLGQTMTVLPGRSACYRCLFPEAPAPGDVPSCQEAGVVGGIAGVIGALQAAEAIKFLGGVGELSSNCLLTYDALSGRWRRVRIARNPRCPVCAELTDAVPAAGPANAPDRAPGRQRLDAAGRARYGE